MPFALRDNSSYFEHIFNVQNVDAPALISNRTVTYGELEKEIEHWRQRLEECGVRKGSLVALKVASSFTFVYLLYATWKLKAAVLLLDTRLKDSETTEMLEMTKPVCIVTSSEQNSPFSCFVEEVSIGMQQGATQGSRLNRQEDALLLFTSGTTSRPKLIGRTRKDIMRDLIKLAQGGDLTTSDRIVSLAPLTHTYGLFNGLLQTIAAGASLVFTTSNQTKHMVNTMREKKVTILYGVPMHYRLLTKEMENEMLLDLRVAISAGERLSSDINKQFQKKFGLGVGQQYGTSETGPLSMDWHGVCGESVGELLRGVEARIVENELRVKLEESPYRASENEDRFADGWFHTSDAANFDAEGFLHLEGRIDDVVNIGGLKVNLLEVEDKLRQFPGIREILVTAFKNNALVAHVEINEGVDENSLFEWCRQHLSDYKIPKKFNIVDSIPRTVTGKVIRRMPE